MVETEEESSVASRKFSFNPVVVALFFAGLLVFSIGLGLILFKEKKEDDGVKIISATQVAGEKITSEIVVDVDGAVVSPGVYKLAADSRVNDAIAASGGMTGDADRAKVNLAAKLADGQKIYIQRVGETATTGSSTSILQVTNSSSSSLISINSASESELDKLPGVGPVTAQKIIGARPYSSIEELLSKKVLTNSVYLKVKDSVGL